MSASKFVSFEKSLKLFSMKVFKITHCSYSNDFLVSFFMGFPQEALDFSWSDHVLNFSALKANMFRLAYPYGKGQNKFVSHLGVSNSYTDLVGFKFLS